MTDIKSDYIIISWHVKINITKIAGLILPNFYNEFKSMANKLNK